MTFYATQGSVVASAHYPRILYQLYQFLLAGGHGYYSLVDSVGDFSSEDNLALYSANVASPYFVVETTSLLPGTSSVAHFFFGAKRDGYFTSLAGWWNGTLTLASAYLFGGVYPGAGWNVTTEKWDTIEDDGALRNGAVNTVWTTSSEWVAEYVFECDQYTITWVHRNTTYYVGGHHGLYTSTQPDEEFPIVSIGGATDYDQSQAWQKWATSGWIGRYYDENNKGCNNYCAIGYPSVTEFWNNQSDVRGYCQDEATPLEMPCPIYEGLGDNGPYRLLGYTRGLRQVSANTSVVPFMDTNPTTKRICLTDGFTMKYAT